MPELTDYKVDEGIHSVMFQEVLSSITDVLRVRRFVLPKHE